MLRKGEKLQVSILLYWKIEKERKGKRGGEWPEEERKKRGEE